MSRLTLFALAFTLVTSSLVGGVPFSLPQNTPLGAHAVQAAELPLYFIENRGQLDKSVSYYVEGNPTDIYFDKSGMAFSQTERDGETGSRATFRIDFVNANPVEPLATGETGPQFSYFLGAQENDWHTGVTTQTELLYRNLWNGIDLHLSGKGGQLKYTFEVAAGADPSQIAFAYSGATLALTEAGELAITTPLATIIDKAPVADQGEKAPVSVSYRELGNNQIGFALGEYDTTKPLTIDPIVVAWANLIGGTGYDAGVDVTVDATGVYVGGEVCDGAVTSFAVTGFDTSLEAGTCDGFAYKLDLDGLGVQYATYLGGDVDDLVEAIAVDPSGNLYLASMTTSTTFPVAGGGKTNQVGQDGAITKLSTDGSSLVYSTHVGGDGSDRVWDINVDDAGLVYAVGATTSATNFGATIGPDTSFNGGTTDDFIGRLNAAGTAWNYLGFIGGTGAESQTDMRPGWNEVSVAIDDTDNAYIISRTASTQTTFPDGDDDANDTMPVGGMDQTHAGGPNDAYVAKISAAGAFSAVTYLGDTGTDIEAGIVLANNSVYAMGVTRSPSFPDDNPGSEPDYNFITSGEGSIYEGQEDAFIIKLNTSLSDPADIARYFGGDPDDWPTGIATDSNGDIYIAGGTPSTENQNFPLKDGPDLTHNGGYDGFVAKLDGTTLATEFSGYVGGSTGEWLYDVAVDAPNSAYYSLEASSPASELPDGHGFYQIPGLDQTQAGDHDHLVFKLTSVTAGVTVTESGGSTNIDEGGATDTYTVVLESRPTSNVTITLSPNAQQTVNDTTLVFEPDNWADPQTVTVTAAQDGIPECSHTGEITQAATSADLNYNGIAVDTVTTQITDIDCTGDAIVVTETDGSTALNELGPTSDTYSVVLTSSPAANVIVTVEPNDQQTTDKSSMLFTGSNWNVPQVVTVTAVVDDKLECTHTGSIAHNGLSSDPTYNATPVATVTPKITDRCDRVEGDSPITTAIAVSQYRFGSAGSAQAAVLAKDSDMVDTFAGTPLSNLVQGPMLLTPTNVLDPRVTAELSRVLSSKDKPIYILGREEAIAPSVYDALRVAGFTDLHQIGGEDRRETAARIAVQIISQQGTATRAFITEDRLFVDSFAAGAAAGTLGADNLVDVVLLNKRGSKTIDGNVRVILDHHQSITSLELIGGPVALDYALESQFTKLYPHITGIHRTDAANRFETNARSNERFFSNPSGVVVANGASTTSSTDLFAALLGSTLAADFEYPIVITEQDELPDAVELYLQKEAPNIGSLVTVGGESLVSSAIFDLLRLIL
jgi:putative cell wall-binding protein